MTWCLDIYIPYMVDFLCQGMKDFMRELFTMAENYRNDNLNAQVYDFLCAIWFLLNADLVVFCWSIFFRIIR